MGTCTVQCAVDDTSCLVLSMSYDSPYLPHQGQCLPPAVCQQYPHVPGLLHHGGPSPLTECSHVHVCIFVCVGRKKRRRRGESNGKGKGVQQIRMTDIIQALTSAIAYTHVNRLSMHAISCSG